MLHLKAPVAEISAVWSSPKFSFSSKGGRWLTSRAPWVILSLVVMLVGAASCATPKDVPEGYGQPREGFSRLDDEGIQRIRNEGFARLDLTQIPTPADFYGVPGSTLARFGVEADTDFPPLAVELVCPGGTLLVHTDLFSMFRNGKSEIYDLKWWEHYDSIGSAKQHLVEIAQSFAIEETIAQNWPHNVDSFKGAPSGVGGPGIGTLGIPSSVEAKSLDNGEGVTFMYDINFDVFYFSQSEYDAVRAFPRAKVRGAPDPRYAER